MCKVAVPKGQSQDVLSTCSSSYLQEWQWVLNASQIQLPDFIPPHDQFVEMLSLCNIHDM